VSAWRSAALVIAAAAGLAVPVALGYGPSDGAVTFVLLLALGGASLTAAHRLAAHRGQLGSLRRQFVVGVALVVGQLAIAIVVGATLMFVSAHDAIVVAILVVFAGLVAARAAQLLAAGVMADIEGLGATMRAVGDGAREPAATTGSDDELAALAHAANAAIVKLDRAERAQRSLVAAVSHDLRTPITSLKLLADAIDDEIVDETTRRRYLRQMGTHIAALSALIDDLFELSQLKAGDVAWSIEHVRLDALVEETVDAMRPHAEAKGVVMSAEIPLDLGPARGNPEKLQRVLFNLIQNAIRHTPADGSVTVLAQPAGSEVVIEVADSGAGIARDDRPRVFEPFFRGGPDAARTRNGTGLGLAIARAIVEAHGGRIWLEDSAGGTRVRFSLPQADPRTRADAMDRSAPGPALR
jgi:signal transduction histidine kinase